MKQKMLLTTRGYRNRVSLLFSKFIDIYEHKLVRISILNILVFSPLLFFGLIFDIFFFIAMIVILAVHNAIYVKACLKALKDESYPYQILHSVYISLGVATCSGITTLLVMMTAFLSEMMGSTIPVGSSLSLILGLIFLGGFSLAIPSFFSCLGVFRLSYHKESRLRFRFVLSVLESIADQLQPRYEMVTKNAHWIKGAFHSLNSFLMEKPFRLELKKIGSYHDGVYTVALLGSPEEIAQTRLNIQSVLDSMGEKPSNAKLRELIIATSRFVRKDIDEKTVTSETSRLWRTTTFLDRAKSRFKSPLAALIVALLALIATIVSAILTVIF